MGFRSAVLRMRANCGTVLLGKRSCLRTASPALVAMRCALSGCRRARSASESGPYKGDCEDAGLKPRRCKGAGLGPVRLRSGQAAAATTAV